MQYKSLVAAIVPTFAMFDSDGMIDFGEVRFWALNTKGEVCGIWGVYNEVIEECKNFLGYVPSIEYGQKLLADGEITLKSHRRSGPTQRPDHQIYQTPVRHQPGQKRLPEPPVFQQHTRPAPPEYQHLGYFPTPAHAKKRLNRQTFSR